MNLPPRQLRLDSREIRGTAVLALDTGFAADSVEGLRLVKASRGSGWFFDGLTLVSWITKGVVQDQGRLVVWGETEAGAIEIGVTPEVWPLAGEEGKTFLRAFALAWVERAKAADPGRFGPSSVVPVSGKSGWGFAFLPLELAGVLDSLQPLDERLPWDHVRHPDLTGTAAWAFATAALSVLAASATLPWAQDDEPSLRQEIRDLKKTLRDVELPAAPDKLKHVWLASLKGTGSAELWKEPSLITWGGAADSRQKTAAAQRLAQRSRMAFWRRRGGLVTAIGAGVLVVLIAIGAALWGWLKPDPTDTWTPDQVVKGYYHALSGLDTELMRKLTAFDRFREPSLVGDQDTAATLYVMRQVRTAYEKQSPIFDAEDWETQGKPAIVDGRQLYGLAGVAAEGSGDRWTVKYRRWVSEGGGGGPVTIIGTQVADGLKLVHTGRGWKITSLSRDSQPLP